MMTGFRLNFAPVKEPLGFVKVLEWLTAVFALGSCGGYSVRTVVSLFCGQGTNETLDVTFSYPFRLNRVLLVERNGTLCNRPVAETHLMGDAESSAEFFVAIAVLALLYSLGALLTYTGYLHVYRESDYAPMLDLAATAIMATLWLLCSSAWAKGLQNMKYATGTVGIRATLALCQEEGVVCEVTELANMRTLNVSVVFGYLNVILWAGNAWFVYKETLWHSQKYTSQEAVGHGTFPVPF
ncbi:hypothetical protein AAFF_G00161850 [Aldrovandia affinis]|uniref:MARVEL domain-containing protein n=1 Tax=Aldrovandia affinis TaxID=143900 RepID=A0AAD7RMG2_9TELE|nr:hypothetical protein AAFF_G00161850 [Aldrovandia affinis]